jgi:peptidyl-prolyl cis-trans isomerase SurA
MAIMKYLRVAGLGVLGLSMAIAADVPKVTIVEEIIAKVNGSIITRGELLQEQKQTSEEMRQQGPQEGYTGARLEEAIAERDKNILRDKIDQLLLVQKGKELNLNVDDQINRQLSQLQQQSGIADPDKFHAWVREQTGISFEDYKARIHDQALTQEVIRQEVGRTVIIKPAELHKYYDEHKSDFVRDEEVYLREIFISTQGKDAAGVALAQRKADDIYKRAVNGEKFSELATANSDDKGAKEGGYIGGYKKGVLRADIEAAVWKLEQGGVTPPIRVANGFLIYKVEQHTKAGLETFDEAQNEIYDKLFMPRMAPAIRQYLTKLREQAYLKIRAGYVDSGAAPGMDTSWVDVAQLKPETVTKAQVSSQTRRKRLLWLIPIPGTKTTVDKSSSSR